MSARTCRRDPPGTAARGRRARGPRVREALARGRRRRLRGDRFPAVLRGAGDRSRRRRGGHEHPRRGEPDGLCTARGRRRDRAVELPGRDPLRDDRGRARRRQRGRDEAGRAVAGLRSAARRRPARRRRARRGAGDHPRRGGDRSDARRAPARRRDRLHRIASGRRRDRRERRPARSRAAPFQAGPGRARRQELRLRRRRRRPRRRDPGADGRRFRLRRPEMLGDIASHRPRIPNR